MTDTKMANPTAGWEKVGDKFYRKIQLYTAVFDQDLELENYIVTGCAYGGAIGMVTLFSYFQTLCCDSRLLCCFLFAFHPGNGGSCSGMA